ncbi:hypothetical protein M408DRAFT_329442 [Serendipita vermifera MAFF 305830]|uniref:Secreted protein n=1 Tax=Serendipita vermifera MAFF 305830 TaxID=933852 RepID=A0A0C2XGU4_SERVB|nr:hypothetical protein M408DRAFT_329442 [Serendipita vermifera MAFF 305830]
MGFASHISSLLILTFTSSTRDRGWAVSTFISSVKVAQYGTPTLLQTTWSTLPSALDRGAVLVYTHLPVSMELGITMQ